MINIGPWWIWDIICITIMLVVIIYGAFSGLYPMLYFVGINIFVILLIAFISPLLAAAAAPVVIKFLSPLFGFLNSIAKLFNGFLTSIISGINFGTDIGAPSGQAVDGTLLFDSLRNQAINLSLTVLFNLIFFIFINLISLIIYTAGLKRKLTSAKINGSVSLLLGGLIGAVLGMSFAYHISSFAASPIFVNNHQDFTSIIKQSDKGAIAEIRAQLVTGNRYKRKALTGKIFSPFPKFGVEYSTECFSKFIFYPLSTIDPNITAPAELQVQLADAATKNVIDAYLTKDYFSHSAYSCTFNGSKDLNVYMRLVTETVQVFYGVNNILDKAGGSPVGSYTVLKSQLDAFTNGGSTKLTSDRLKDFYQAVPNNEFIRVANVLENNSAIGSNYYSDILKDPAKLYEWLENMYLVNNESNKIGFLGFLPNLISGYILIAGWDIVPSSDLVNQLTGLDTNAPNSPAPYYNFYDDAALYWSFVK